MEDVPTLSARIEEKQKRLENRPRSKSKVYPQIGDPELGRAERERQGSLHAKICIFLCTVLPFVTLVATLHRLWFMGIISFQTDHECPDGWLLWSGSCYLYLTQNASWSSALTACGQSDMTDTYLVDISSEEENQFLAQVTAEKFWTAGKQSKQGWKWEPGRRMVTWRKQIITKARRRPPDVRGSSEVVMPVGILWQRLPQGPRGLTVQEEAPQEQPSLSRHQEATEEVEDSNREQEQQEMMTDSLEVNGRLRPEERAAVNTVSGTSTETVDWPVNMTGLLVNYNLDYAEDLLNIDGELQKVLIEQEDGAGLTGLEECLLVGGGDWYSEDCSSSRFFVCKSPSISDNAKREKKICKKRNEVKVYNTNLYYMCDD